MQRRRLVVVGPLGRRLVVAFVVVAVVALGTVVAFAERAVRDRTGPLDDAGRGLAERRIVRALADAYAVAGSWDRVDLTAARVLAQSAGLEIVVLDARGAGVATISPPLDLEDPGTGGGTGPVTARQAPPGPAAATVPGEAGAGASDGPGAGTPGRRSQAGRPAEGSGGAGSGGAGSGGAGSGAAGSGAAGSGGAGSGGAGSGGAGSGAAGSGGAGSGAAGSGAAGSGGAAGGGRSAGGSGQGPGGDGDRAGKAWRDPAARPAVDWVPVAATAGPAPGPVAGSDRPPGEGLPVVVGGRVVGRVIIGPVPGRVTPAAEARDAVLAAVRSAAVGAVLVAILLALFAAWRIVRPLVALAGAARAMEGGDPDPLAQVRPGPGELGEVARAFSRAAQGLRRADEARRAFTADVAHELRTPVTVLRGLTEEVLDGVSPLTTGTVDSLHEEALRLERLVDDLVTLSAAQAAGLRMVRAPLDLRDVVTHAAEALRPRFAGAGQRLVVRLPAEPADVEGDDLRLEQVVANLLANAHAHTPDGGLVRVEVAPGDGGRAVWRIEVSDSGPGIAPEDLPHVFRRFYRGRGSERRPGTGIGLAVVAELVATHDGTVAAASPPGRGAVLTVTLPARGPAGISTQNTPRSHTTSRAVG